jgi:prepilin-type processing-associated H-X9-DG protein
MKPPSETNHAFTRSELLFVLAGLALLIFVVFPALANQRPRSQRVICANNLRQVGAAMQLWGNDHDDRPPHHVPLDQGGTQLHTLAPNCWLHFSWISNELAAAAALFCPSDTGQPARDFTGNPASGYIHPNFANRATSYFLAHAATGKPSHEVLAGDRNMDAGASTGGCSVFRTTKILVRRPADIRWSNGLHNLNGNLLYFDGRVEQLDIAGLRAAVATGQDDNGSFHFIVPR